MKLDNLFEKIPKDLSKELFQSIVSSDNIKIERIISGPNSIKKEEWYDQNNNEFVLIIQGSADLLFENNERVAMKKGDYILIPAHKKHRVEKTSEKEETIWLAVFYD